MKCVNVDGSRYRQFCRIIVTEGNFTRPKVREDIGAFSKITRILTFCGENVVRTPSLSHKIILADQEKEIMHLNS